MRIKYLISMFCLLLLLQGKSHAQALPNFDLPTSMSGYIPQSPTAKELGRYGSTPTNLYTGLPSIDIPLMTADALHVTVPISLSYHASGVKVEDLSSWVGQGWSLNAGGVITREIRDMPDDAFYSYGDLFCIDDCTLCFNCPDCTVFPNSPGCIKCDGPTGCFKYIPTTHEEVGYLFHGSEVDDLWDVAEYSDYSEDEKLWLFGQYFNLEIVNDIPPGASLPDDGIVVEWGFHTSPATYRWAKVLKPIVRSKDTEPDMFNFNFGGYSGQFVFNSNGEPQIIAESNLKIEYTLSTDPALPSSEYPDLNLTSAFGGGITDFTITTPDGVKYVFDEKELSIADGRGQGFDNATRLWGECSPFLENPYQVNFDEVPTSFTSWYLSEIITPEGGTEVRFNYDDQILMNHSSMTESMTLTCDPTVLDVDEHYNYGSSVNTILGKRLRSIEFGWLDQQTTYGTIDFNVSTASRKDLFYPAALNIPANYDEARLLDNIVLNTSDGSPVRQIDFSYSEFAKTSCNASSGSWEAAHRERIRLDQIQEKGWNNNGELASNDPYEFKYDATPLPPRHSPQRDYWGYYNGNGANTMVPKLYGYPQEADPGNSNFQVFQTVYSIFRRASHAGQEVIINAGGADRNANLTYAKAGILTGVTYPTGGNTEFTFELNEFYSDRLVGGTSGNNHNIQGGGLRVASISDSGGTTRNFGYNKDFGNGFIISTGRLIELPHFARSFNNNAACGGTGELGLQTRTRVSSGSLRNLSTSKGGFVGYEMVTESIDGNGRTENTYDVSAHFETITAGCNNGTCLYEQPIVPLNDSPPFPDNSPFAPRPNYDWNRGSLMQTSMFNESGEEVKRIENNYAIFNSQKIKAIKVSENRSAALINDTYAKYYVLTGDKRISQSIETDFFDNGAIVTTTSYAYGNNHQYPIAVTTSNGGMSVTSSTKYPEDITAADGMDMGIINGLIAEHKLSIPLIQTTSGSASGGTKVEYGDFSGDLLPEKFYTQNQDGSWELTGRVEEYSYEGFPQLFRKEHYTDAVEMTWIDGQLDSKQYKDWIWDYTYDTHSRQVASIREIDGQISNFQYDGLMRLSETSARNGNIVSTNTYNFGGGNNFVETLTEFSNTDDQTSRKFFDGLGRFTKLVNIGYTYSGNDAIMTSKSYDDAGRLAGETSLGNGGESYIYEPSPLARIQKTQTGTGEIENFYHTNATAIYGHPANTLFRVDVKDENGVYSSTFTDMLGRVVLSRGYLAPNINLSSQFVDTYTNFDSFGNVSSITAPDNGVYSYSYDNENRLIGKYVPGGGSTSYIYNDRSQIVTTLDPNGILFYTTYDDYDRPLEIRKGGPAGDLMTKNYYDDKGLISYGKLTRTDVMVVETGVMLTTEHEFDGYGRIYQSTSDNHLGGNDVVTNTMDFADNILSTLRVHSGDENVTFLQTNGFDHSFRLESITHRIDGGPGVKINEQGYNEQDKVLYKRMFNVNGDMIQGTSYGYNSRGWLTRINTISETEELSIPICTNVEPVPCPITCDYSVDFDLQGDVAIIDLIISGQSANLNYPYTINTLVQFENDLENWLTNNGFVFQSLIISPSGETGFNLSITNTNASFSSLSITNTFPHYFSVRDCEGRGRDLAQDQDICDKCSDFGYSCDRCPYWQLPDPCTTCGELGVDDCSKCEKATDDCEQCLNLGYKDCNDCPLRLSYVTSQKFKLEFNHAALAKGETALMRVTENSVNHKQNGTREAVAIARMALVGKGVIANVPNTHVVEVEMNNAPIVVSTLEEELAHLEDEVLRKLREAGINQTEVLNNAAAAVAEVARESWAGNITLDKKDTSPNNPDLFSEEIVYNQGSSYVDPTQVQNNGNISALVWQVAGRKYQSYAFRYDRINRVVYGAFQEQDGDPDLNNYGVSYSYDKVGNITSIRRRGVSDYCEAFKGDDRLEYDQIDDLRLTYSNHRLEKVVESSHKEFGYKGDGGAYTYDDAGRLTNDGNKKIDIQYNFLNLPNNISSQIDPGNSISMAYDASGEKVQKQVSGTNPDGTSASYVKDYIDGIEYKNNTIEAIYHDEGRVSKNADGEWQYDYYLKDHLGNVRVVFSDLNNDGELQISTLNPDLPAEENELLQESHNYPFGMEMDGPWKNIEHEPKNDYRYNGKELTSAFGLDWLDYGARWYDPGIARWHAPDPVAESYAAFSVFNYSVNNPLRFVDPDGYSPSNVNNGDPVVKTVKTVTTYNATLYNGNGNHTLAHVRINSRSEIFSSDTKHEVRTYQNVTMTFVDVQVSEQTEANTGDTEIKMTTANRRIVKYDQESLYTRVSETNGSIVSEHLTPAKPIDGTVVEYGYGSNGYPSDTNLRSQVTELTDFLSGGGRNDFGIDGTPLVQDRSAGEKIQVVALSTVTTGAIGLAASKNGGGALLSSLVGFSMGVYNVVKDSFNEPEDALDDVLITNEKTVVVDEF